VAVMFAATGAMQDQWPNQLLNMERSLIFIAEIKQRLMI